MMNLAKQEPELCEIRNYHSQFTANTVFFLLSLHTNDDPCGIVLPPPISKYQEQLRWLSKRFSKYIFVEI